MKKIMAIQNTRIIVSNFHWSSTTLFHSNWFSFIIGHVMLTITINYLVFIMAHARDKSFHITFSMMFFVYKKHNHFFFFSIEILIGNTFLCNVKNLLFILRILFLILLLFFYGWFGCVGFIAFWEKKNKSFIHNMLSNLFLVLNELFILEC